MTRRVLTFVMLLSVLVAPLSAELKYTMKVEAHESTVRSTTPPNPMMTMLSGMVIGMIAPPGGLEMTVVVGERGMRVEYNKAYTIVPAGASLVVAPDGAITVINPATKTYWKSARPDAVAALGKAPVVTVKPSGESATIAGVRAERAAVEVRVALPLPAGMPGLPTELVMTGDAWLAERYKSYAAMSSGFSAMGALGLDKMNATGLLMRSILRSDLFGGKEIESVVTNIGEVTVPASTFEVPAGYTQVEQPVAPMGMPTGR